LSRYGVYRDFPQQRNKEQKRIQASLEGSRGSASRYFPHHQAKFERTGMNEQPFDDVVVPPQVGSSHGSGFIHVGDASFDSLATLAQQALSALASDPPAVLIYR
jgi:hypothetical protein